MAVDSMAVLAAASQLAESCSGEGSRGAVTVFGVAAVLLVMALAAGLVPARRAMRVDPVKTLRTYR